MPVGTLLRNIYLTSYRSGRGRTPKISAREVSAVSGIRLLSFVQHGNVLLDAPRPRLRPLGVLNLVQDRVTVRAVERGEELPSRRVLLQNSAQVVRHRDRALRIVGGVPPAVRSGPLDLP